MAERKSVYVSPERHRALKAGALATGKTVEQYTEDLLQIAQPLREQRKIIEA